MVSIINTADKKGRWVGAGFDGEEGGLDAAARPDSDDADEASDG